MSAYFPRSGSKVEMAAIELKHGPKSVDILARVLSVKRSNVAVLLKPACSHGYMLQFHDEHGVPHWVLSRNAASGDSEQEGRNRNLAGWPQVRNVVNHAPPSEEARLFADPFGRTKRFQAAH
jgi:hypothetical protein